MWCPSMRLQPHHCDRAGDHDGRVPRGGDAPADQDQHGDGLARGEAGAHDQAEQDGLGQGPGGPPGQGHPRAAARAGACLACVCMCSCGLIVCMAHCLDVRGLPGCAPVVLAVHNQPTHPSPNPENQNKQAVQRGAGRSAYQGIGGGGDYMGAGSGFDGGGGCTWVAFRIGLWGCGMSCVMCNQCAFDSGDRALTRWMFTHTPHMHTRRRHGRRERHGRRGRRLPFGGSAALHLHPQRGGPRFAPDGDAQGRVEGPWSSTSQISHISYGGGVCIV